MFWNKKTPAEKDKEVQLNIVQLKKLIQKAIVNAQNAVSGYSTWIENKYKSSKDESNTLSALIGLTDTHRFVEQNKEVLLELENITTTKQLKIPAAILKKLKNIQSANDNIDVELAVSNKMLLEDIKNDSGSFLTHMTMLDRGVLSRLSSFLETLIELQELLNLHFSYTSFDYVNASRLDELNSVENENYDLSKLIRICEEINSNYQYKNYLSVSMLVRVILDHVPPIFGFKTFVEVANNYGGKSLKKSLQNLQNSSRNISDSYLHETVKQKESLPNETQIDFRNDLDVLLGEIIRILK